MADISSTILPNGGSYNFKDSTLRSTITNLAVKSDYLLVDTTAKDNIVLPNYNMADAPQTLTYTLGVTKSGYTPLGVVAYNIANAGTNGVNGSYCELSSFYLSSTTQAKFTINTMATTNGTKAKVTLAILYRKN